ncbi:hypothetical protein ACNHUS_35410 [Actinomycetes bacterium M1A6_2h]
MRLLAARIGSLRSAISPLHRVGVITVGDRFELVVGATQLALVADVRGFGAALVVGGARVLCSVAIFCWIRVQVLMWRDTVDVCAAQGGGNLPAGRTPPFGSTLDYRQANWVHLKQRSKHRESGLSLRPYPFTSGASQ